jgi:hypothetical protein
LKNSRVYSCILIKTDVLPAKQRWRGVYNEDTDLFLRLVKKGHGTLLCKSLLMKKHGTQQIAGGNTDTVYGSDQDRRKFAESLCAQHPEDVRVVKRYGRYHHEIITGSSVAWKKNDLKPLENVWTKLPLSNDYNIVLQELEKRGAAPAAAAPAAAASASATVSAAAAASAAATAQVRYPVYIPSKGRPDGVKVAEALGDCGIDYKIVVEPAQYGAYEKIHGEDRLLTLPEDGRGIAYAREWIKKQCKTVYHWQLDDDKVFKRRVQDETGKWSNQPASASAVMCEIEAFVSQYSNIGAAGPITHTFAHGFDKRGERGDVHHFNRQVCSFLLIKTAQAAEFRPGTIEDTDFNLQILTGREGDLSEPRADAECTVLFHRLLVEGPAGQKAGGNHDGLFYGRADVLRGKQQRVIDMWPTRGFEIKEKKTKAKGTSLKSTGQCWAKFKQSVEKK